MQLDGKLAVVTGATSGIGLAVADRLAARGARVVLVARTRDRLEQVSESIRLRRGWAEGVRLDVTDPAMVEEMAEEITGRHGFPDLLVNAAGSGRWRFLEEEGPEGPFETMVPYLGAAAMTRAWLPAMLARRSGAIVNITSMAAYTPFAGATTYIAARCALRGMHEALRMDLAGTGIRPILAVFAKVSSGYLQNNPGSLERIPRAQSMIPTLTPEQAARALVAGVEGKASLVVAPMQLRVVLHLARLFPGLSRSVMRSGGYKRKKAVALVPPKSKAAKRKAAKGKAAGSKGSKPGPDLLGRARPDPVDGKPKE